MTSRPALAAPAADWDSLAHASGLPRLEARVLLEHASGRSREWLIAHGDEAAEAQAAQVFANLARRRLAGEPIAYLTGRREFAGRQFEVSTDVLIPRPETELLLQLALERAPRQARVLELGTGSGVLAVSLACERPDLQVLATDRSAAALAAARRNAGRLAGAALAGARLRLRRGSWWQAVDSRERFELVLSNPPYVAEGDAHLARGDLRFEPREALAAGPDGLEAVRAIVAAAPRHLAAGGWLLLEHGHDQQQALQALLAAGGWRDIATLPDAAGLPRVTTARAGGARGGEPGLTSARRPS